MDEAETRAELDLDVDEEDVEVAAEGIVDLGDICVQYLPVALDPYPRSAKAEDALKEAGVLSEEQAGPFAALAALKGK